MKLDHPLILVLSWLIGLLIGGFIGDIIIANNRRYNSAVRDQFEIEAIQHGKAVWEVDANGNRIFRWK